MTLGAEDHEHTYPPVDDKPTASEADSDEKKADLPDVTYGEVHAKHDAAGELELFDENGREKVLETAEDFVGAFLSSSRALSLTLCSGSRSLLPRR